MPNALYAKACAPAQTDSPTPAILTKEEFHLSPEQLVEIERRWKSHLVRQNITSYAHRILNAIYRQTLDFQKWEDDISGKRFQQITNIRYDHANKTLKYLAANNAILMRDGYYGKWVSINFNFSSWGEKGKKAQQRSNNPVDLLPDYCREQPIDSGNTWDEMEDNPAENASGFVAEKAEHLQMLSEEELAEQPELGYTIDKNNKNNNNKKITTTTKTENKKNNKKTATTNQDSESLQLPNIVAQLHELVEKLTEKMSDKIDQKLQALEYNLHTLSQQTLSAPSAETQQPATMMPSVESDIDTTPNVEDNQARLAGHIKHALLGKTPDTHTASHIPVDHMVATTEPSVNQAISPQFPSQSSIMATKSLSLEKLRYPSNLDRMTQKGLADLLIQAGKHAQDILDLLAERMKNTADPVRNPILYYAGLLKKLKNNDLDFTTLRIQAEATKPKPAPTKKETHLAKLKEAYSDAAGDYRHFKQLYENMAKRKQCTAEEYIASDAGMVAVWTNVCEQFEKAKSALDVALA